jgi:hypothetical protein
MAINVDTVRSEVTLEPETAAPQPYSTSTQAELERARALRARVMELDARTAAEGFDD